MGNRQRLALDQHLEQILGPIACGWQTAGDPGGIQVCLFENSPAPNVVTYATLGLSRHVLEMPAGRHVRQELLLSVADAFADEDLAKLVAFVADGVVRDHRALLRGSVLPLGHPVAKNSRCSSLYVTGPGVFPPDLAVHTSTDPATVFALLLPIHPDEAEVAAQRGWSVFEDLLERAANLDVFDIERGSIFE